MENEGRLTSDVPTKF
jgi:hypothetical protein